MAGRSHFNVRSLAVAAAVCFAAVLPDSAQSATIEFTNWSRSGTDTVIPTFTISDDPLDRFRVNIAIDPLSPNQFGKVTGIFFDLEQFR